MALTKWQFLVGTLALVAIVFLVGYLTAVHVIRFPFPEFAIFALVAQWFLVSWRDKLVKSRFRWRSWYSGIFIALAAFVISLVPLPTHSQDPIRTSSQAILGYFLFSYVLNLPVIAAFCFDKKPVSENHLK